MSQARARAGVLVGLLFLTGPLSDLLGRSYGPGHLAALLLGTALFVVLYISLLPPSPWVVRRGPAGVVLGLALLPLLAIVLLLGGAPRSFAALFVYFAAAVGLLLPAYAAIGVIFATALGIGVTGAIHGIDSSSVAATVLTVVAIGMMMSAFGRIARANRELKATRDELARLAVSEERLRIARDLHDLLGHSLSVIALKSELARKLVERDPERAAAELDDIQAVTRDALAERTGGRAGLSPALARERARGRQGGAHCGGNRLRARAQRGGAAGGRRCGARLGRARGSDERHPPQPRAALRDPSRRRRRARRRRDRG